MIGGIFLDTFLVILLVGLATGMVGGVVMLRRVLQLTTARTETQVIAARAERDRQAHAATLQSIGQEQALLQLTQGDNIKPQQEASHEEAEAVVPRRGDVHVPYTPTRDHRAATAVRPEEIEDGEFE